MTDLEHECHGLIYWIKDIEAECEYALKRARNEGMSKSGAINFIAEICERVARIDEDFKRMKKPPAMIPSTRLIPDFEVPSEQTNASLRKLLRESHERETHLQNRLQAILLCYKNHGVPGIDVMAQIAIDALKGVGRFEKLLSQFGAKKP